MYNTLEHIKTESKIHKALLNIVGDQGRMDDILFLENQNTLGDTAAENFRIWCVENKIRHNALYNISDINFDYLKSAIEWADIIVFETTGTYEIVGKLREFILSIKDRPKKIIECYIHEPKFKGLPKEAIHKMWVLNSYDDDMLNWQLSKLSKTKMYWETIIVRREK